MNDLEKPDQLDALLENWRQPEVRPDFTASLLEELPAQEGDDVREVASSPKITVFPGFSGSGAVMGAAAAVLLLLVVALTHTSRIAMEDDLVELEGYSNDAVSELYRLIHLEGLASSEDWSAEEADTALLLFATGG